MRSSLFRGKRTENVSNRGNNLDFCVQKLEAAVRVARCLFDLLFFVSSRLEFCCRVLQMCTLPRLTTQTISTKGTDSETVIHAKVSILSLLANVLTILAQVTFLGHGRGSVRRGYDVFEIRGAGEFGERCARDLRGTNQRRRACAQSRQPRSEDNEV